MAAALLMQSAGFQSALVRAQGQPSPPRNERLSRMERLDAWLAAVEQHEPGLLDDSVAEIGGWGAGDLQWVSRDVSSLVSLVRDPGVLIFFAPSDPPGSSNSVSPAQQAARGRPAQVLYSGQELRHLRELAVTLGGPTEGRENRILRRGAMLHADIELMAPPEMRARSSSSGPQRFLLRMNDGRAAGLEVVVNHWELARGFLDRVSIVEKPGGQRRGPEADPTVRLWYVATSARLQAAGELDPAHFGRALRLFPNDPEVLFFNATYHETLAGARRQAAMRGAPREVSLGIGSRGEELGQAERLYKRSLDANQGFDEARLRYGRVLGQRGRHAEAVTELEKVTAKEPLLDYYKSLFLGGELEALGKNDEATRAYERATTIMPRAQSARVGLSRVTSGSDRLLARDALTSLVALPETDDRDDPWWVYEAVQGRDADARLEALHQSIAQERR